MAELEFSSLHLVHWVRQNTCAIHSVSPSTARFRFTWRSYCSSPSTAGFGLMTSAYSHRPQSGHLTCYLDRTYHLLPTAFDAEVEPLRERMVPFHPIGAGRYPASQRQIGNPAQQVDRPVNPA